MIYDLSKPLEQAKFKEKVNYLYENGAQVELKQVRLKRSLSQNSYFHVVVTLFALEYGEDLDSMKQILKHWRCLYADKAGAVVYKKTSKMDSKELTEFIEWVRNKASKDLGLYIPTSEEYLENQAEINRLMYQNQNYL